VLIGCRRRGRTLLLQVVDTGIGIPPGETAAIFEEFKRIDHAHAPGLGLGLAIVRRSAELLGQNVRVRSSPGKGSTFEIEVPLAD
jgi:signal transduction histidine kinase